MRFQDLDVYKGSIQLVAFAHDSRTSLVGSGHADLLDQLKRAAQSITLNIAEGCGRWTKADKKRHFAIARGSAMEVAAVIDLMRVQELMTGDQLNAVAAIADRVIAMLTRMIEPR